MTRREQSVIENARADSMSRPVHIGTDELRLYLPTQTPNVSLDCPFKMLPGKVAVRMDPERTQEGSILIPSTVSGRLRPDSGTVIGVGPRKMSQTGEYEPEITLKIGDRVLVRPYDGLWIDDVRFYGGGNDGGDFVSVAWWDQIVCVWRDGWCPTGGNVRIHRFEKESKFETPDPIYSELALVTSVGDYCDPSLHLERVAYFLDQPDDMMTFAFGENPASAIIPASCVKAIRELVQHFPIIINGF